MSEFARFLRAVRRKVPGLQVEADEAVEGSGGSTFARLAIGNHIVLLEWRPGHGFGIAAGGDGAYGEGPDEVFPDRTAAITRVVGLLTEGGRTLPPRAVLLRELRAAAGLSQEALAGRLGVGQPAVSKVERRSDVSLSTLRDYVRALGGSLELRAQVGDEEFVLVQFDAEAV